MYLHGFREGVALDSALVDWPRGRFFV